MTDTPTDRLVTVFGGSGFLGRYAIRALAQSGFVSAPRSPPDLAFDLQPLGHRRSTRCSQSLPRLVMRRRRLDVVINLVGIMNPSGAQTEAVQAECGYRRPRRQGKRRVIHVSAIGADARSASAYALEGRGREAALAERPLCSARPSCSTGGRFLQPLRVARACCRRCR